MNIATQIKQLLDVEQVFEYYGGKPNRRGFVSCPFHSEKTPSLSMKKGKWKCFGCGEGGSVIDYVMKLFNINLSQAIVRLNHDFNLGVINEKPDLRKVQELREKLLDKERMKQCKALINEWHMIEFKKHYRRFHDLKPTKRFEELNDEFIEAMINLNNQEARMEVRTWK